MTPGSAVRHASVARHVTACATWPGREVLEKSLNFSQTCLFEPWYIIWTSSGNNSSDHILASARDFGTYYIARVAKGQASLRIYADSPEPSLLAYIKHGYR